MHVLNVAHILVEKGLSVKGRVLQEAEVGKKLPNMVLDGSTAQSPSEIGLQPKPYLVLVSTKQHLKLQKQNNIMLATKQYDMTLIMLLLLWLLGHAADHHECAGAGNTVHISYAA